MMLNWNQIIKEGQAKEANIAKLDTIAGGTPRWVIVSGDFFTKKLVQTHTPFTEPTTVYSDDVRDFIAAKLGYSPSDAVIDFVLQHNWRRR